MSQSKVIAFGGIFICSPNPKELAQWYQTYLGVSFEGKSYTSLAWKGNDHQGEAYNVFSIFKEHDDYLKPSTKSFMLNFRVNDLDSLIAELKQNGINPLSEQNEVMDGIGKFNWVLDPDGNKVELWEQLS